jgi:hypothetical protein
MLSYSNVAVRGVIESKALNQGYANIRKYGGKVAPIRVRDIWPCEEISNIQSRAVADVLNNVTSPIGIDG